MTDNTGDSHFFSFNKKRLSVIFSIMSQKTIVFLHQYQENVVRLGFFIWFSCKITSKVYLRNEINYFLFKSLFVCVCHLSKGKQERYNDFLRCIQTNNIDGLKACDIYDLAGKLDSVCLRSFFQFFRF